MNEPFVHESATVEDGASIGAGTKVWHRAHVRAGATIGAECVIGGGVYVGAGVTVGSRCKIQNNALVYEGAALADGVFVGPAAVITNDHVPRAVNADGSLKDGSDWTLARTIVEEGASIGAGAVLVAPVRVGAWAIVGAGSVVVRDVPPHALVVGNPARLVGFVCRCATRVKEDGTCPACGRTVPAGS